MKSNLSPPSFFITQLKSFKSGSKLIPLLNSLRCSVRGESANWMNEYISNGGYEILVKVLQDNIKKTTR